MTLTRHIEDPIDNYLLSNSPGPSFYSINHTSQHSLSTLISPMTPDLRTQNQSQKEKSLYTLLPNCFSKEGSISIN